MQIDAFNVYDPAAPDGLPCFRHPILGEIAIQKYVQVCVAILLILQDPNICGRMAQFAAKVDSKVCEDLVDIPSGVGTVELGWM